MRKSFTLSNGTVVNYPLTGNTVVACNGDEEVITYQGRNYLYVWNKDIKLHFYYCFEDGLYYPNCPWGV